MEFTIKPFSEVINDVGQRVELIKFLGTDAPIRNYDDVYGSDIVSDPEHLKILTDTISKEAFELSAHSKGKNIATHFDKKYHPHSYKKVSGWILGSEVLVMPELGYRHDLQITGMFLAVDGSISKFQNKAIGPNNIPNASVGYNSKLYDDKYTVRLFKYSGLRPIRFTPELTKDSRGLVAVREYLAEFALKHSLQDKLRLN